MNKNKTPNVDEIEATAKKSGRTVHYEQDLLFDLLDLPIPSEEEAPEIIKELSGERVFLSSAIPLSYDQKHRIGKQFMRITGRTIRSFTTILDPSLLIGVRIQSERFYYELSGQQILSSMVNQISLADHEEVIQNV